MAPRYYLKDASNATVEVTDRIDRKHPPTLKENAEEGSVAMSTVVLSDPGMDLDIHGLQPFWAIEDDSEATDDVLFGGFLAAQEISRGSGDAFEPLGRVWSCEIVDANSLWNRRVMTGSDNKRPAETDVARVQWLFTTAETGIWDDETTYVYTGSTHNMDKVDYRGQYRDQVIGDCAQASGKNWWSQLHETGTGREWFVWYGLDSETGYSSDLYLTNDTSYMVESEITDGTSLVWPISEDTRLRTDPQRVYSGVYLRYEKGAVYRHDSATTSAFCRRDYVADYPNVKSKTKAIARATRLLDKLDTQDDRITTTVRLPKGKATMIRAGMRVPFLATHLPGYTTWQWLRVLSCAVTPTESGDDYDLALELAPTGQSASGPAAAAGGFMANMSESWPVGSFWEANLEASDDGSSWTEILTASELSVAQGAVTFFPSPLRHAYWRVHLTVNWTTVFMNPSHFLRHVLIDADNQTDLLGNGWTPGGTDATGITADSTTTFAFTGPADGFSMGGYVGGVPTGSAYGSQTVDQTGAWGIDQTDIINNTVRTLHYYWTWTL